MTLAEALRSARSQRSLTKDVLGLALEARGPAELWPALARRLMAFFRCERATLFQRVGRDQLVSRYAHGLTIPLALKVGEGVAGWAAKTAAPYLCNAPYKDPRFLRDADRATRFRTRNLVAYPLIERGDVVGVLQLINKEGGFGAKDLAALAEIGAEIAVLFAKFKVEEAQAELGLQLAQAEKMAALGRLAGGMAHEVNNPLMSVLGFVQVLLRSPGMPEDSLKTLLKVDAELRRLKGIVCDLLGFARAGSGLKEPVALPMVLEDSLGLLASELRYRRVALERRLPPRLPRVLGNANQLKQVFLNLLLNAMQALEGRRDGRIVLSARAENGTVVAEVSDNGPGVPGELRDRIFEPFFTTRGEKGTGLGLSVSLGLVESHGGRLTLADAAAGATFRVELPAAIASRGARKGP